MNKPSSLKLDLALCALLVTSMSFAVDDNFLKHSKNTIFFITLVCILFISGAYAKTWWIQLSSTTLDDKSRLDAVLIQKTIKNKSLLLSFYTPQHNLLGADLILSFADLGQKLEKRINNYVFGLAILFVGSLCLLMLDPGFKSGKGLFSALLHQPIFFVLAHGVLIYLSVWACSFFFLVQYAKIKGKTK